MSPKASEEPSVFDQILAGGNREVQMLVAQGMFPLPPQELVPIQVALAVGDDEELAAAAGESLAGLDPKIAASVVAESTDSELMAYLGRVLEHPVVTEAILRNRAVTAAVLGAIAPRLTPELQEMFLLRQDLIVENPEILDHLEGNVDLSAYSERRILEYREHLVPVEAEPALDPSSVETTDDVGAKEATPEEVEAAIAAARSEPAEGERDEVTGLSEAQIRSLPVPVRMKLARGAPRSLRAILIKDKSSMVARAVLNGNALTESEIELVASNRSVAEEVLTMIAQNRQWNRKYTIIHALIKNPRTNVGMAVRLVSQLSIRDLRNLSRDRNVSEAVRNTAARLYRIKAV